MKDAIHHIQEANNDAVGGQLAYLRGIITKRKADQYLLQAIDKQIELFDFLIWNPEKYPEAVMLAIQAGMAYREARRALIRKGVKP